MRLKRGLVLLFLLVIVISGCNSAVKNPDDEVVEHIYRGNQGLQLKFMQNLPPNKIYDVGSLNIVAELENKGTSDLSAGKCMVHLSGYDESIIRGIDKEKPCGNNLWEKRPGFPEGGFDVVEFNTDLIRLPQGLDSFLQKFIMSGCYEYETTANPIVCIDPGIYKIRSIKEGCIVKDVSLAGGQGAPVSVSKVDVDMVGENKAAFTVHIQNVGGGQVLRRGTGLTGSTAHSCPFNLEYDDYNVVDYEVSMSGGFLIKCSPAKIRLVNNNAKLFCTFNVPGEDARTTPLRVKLRYNYLQSISKSVEIIKTPE